MSAKAFTAADAEVRQHRPCWARKRAAKLSTISSPPTVPTAVPAPHTPRPVEKSAETTRRSTNRREPVTPVTATNVPRSSSVVASSSAPARAYAKNVPGSVRKVALRRVLGDLTRGEKLFTVDSFSISDGKTKSFISSLKDVTDADRKVLLVGKLRRVHLARRTQRRVDTACHRRKTSTSSNCSCQRVIILVGDSVETLAHAPPDLPRPKTTYDHERHLPGHQKRPLSAKKHPCSRRATTRSSSKWIATRTSSRSSRPWKPFSTRKSSRSAPRTTTARSVASVAPTRPHRILQESLRPSR